MTENITNVGGTESRIARASAARTPADAQGRPDLRPTVHTYEDGVLQSATPGPQHKPAVFTYDERGLLVTATPAAPDADE